MLTISSSLIERTTTAFKSNQPKGNFYPTTTEVSQKPQLSQDTVSLSSQGIEKVMAPEMEPQPNPYANTIVDFIRKQLQRDLAAGASGEELTTRLAAGYQGFLQGYSEAFALLGSSLPDEVNQELAATKAQVGEQVAKLAQEFGITVPKIEDAKEAPAISLEDAFNHLVQATNTDSLATSIPASGGHTGLAQSRSLNLHLTTAEGDIIELIANSKYSSVFEESEKGINGSTEQSTQWSFSVAGNLNDQERGAIADFINQLGGLADEFYQGDLTQAVNQAQKLGFDHQQISEFSLSLQQVDIKRVENAYGGPQSGSSEVKNPQQTRWQALGQWLTQLDQLRTESLKNALPKNWIEQLSQQSLAQLHPEHESENGFILDQLATKQQ